MSDENVTRVRTAYEAMSRGELEPIRDMLDPEVEYRSPDYAIEPGARRGREEFIRTLEELLETFDYAEMAPEEIVDGDERIVVTVRIRAQGKGSGVPIDTVFGHLLRLRGDRLISLEWFSDPAHARRPAFDRATMRRQRGRVVHDRKERGCERYGWSYLARAAMDGACNGRPGGGRAARRRGGDRDGRRAGRGVEGAQVEGEADRR